MTFLDSKDYLTTRDCFIPYVKYVHQFRSINLWTSLCQALFLGNDYIPIRMCIEFDNHDDSAIIRSYV